MASFPRVSETDVVNDICAFDWPRLSQTQLVDAAFAYYWFSIQFRENLKIARRLYPEDLRLQELEAEECDTANLSPWRGVAAPGERMNHDEFLRRSLALASIEPERRMTLSGHGQEYLDSVAAMDPRARALSMVSYEGGGLARVFCAMLTARNWNDPMLRAFRHFLLAHLRLDSHHGTLVDHLEAGEQALPLWIAFRELLVACVPALVPREQPTAGRDRRGNAHPIAMGFTGDVHPLEAVAKD